MRTYLCSLALCCGPMLATAQDRAPVEPKSLPAPDQEVAPVKPSVEKLDGKRFRVGTVKFDSESREIYLAAQVNMTEGLLEYLAVHENGKVHESLFVTKASPTDLNLAFILLGYKPSRELYRLPNETGGLTTEFPEVPAEIKTAARVDIDVEWQHEGKPKRQSVNQWVQHAGTKKEMPSDPWVYGASEFVNGKYAPELSGDFAAIFVSLSSPINFSGKDNMDDTVWLPFTERVPEIGTNVVLIFKPHKPEQKP